MSDRQTHHRVSSPRCAGRISDPRRAWSARGYAIVVAAIAAASLPAAAQETATPQRPSLSFNALTVPAHRFEMELGGTITEGGGAVPIFLKYGLTDRTELEAAFDAVRQVETDDGEITSVGDLSLWVRSHTDPSAEGQRLAVSSWVKAPIARDDAGTGEVDAGVIGILSMPVGRFGLDANVWLSALGREDATVGQVQGIVTLGYSASKGWSVFAEAAWQQTAGEGSGGFFDSGVSFTASRWTVLDIAAGVGWNEGYPDWAATAGWTILFPGGG